VSEPPTIKAHRNNKEYVEIAYGPRCSQGYISGSLLLLNKRCS
jgi:hypothetical protein